MSLSNVDLPHPFAPSTAIRSPGYTEREMPESAGLPSRYAKWMSASSRRGARGWRVCAVIVMSGDVCTRTEYHDHDEQAPFRGPEPRAGGEPCIAREAAGGHCPAHPLPQVGASFPGAADP